MGKQEFLEQLRKQLSGLPQADIEERLNFYSEMIDDRIEEGLSEEEAVLAVGPIEALTPITNKKEKPGRQLKAWEIVLLALGSPIWLALLISAGAVVISVYVSLWSVVVSLWAVFGGLVGCGAFGIASGIATVCTGNPVSGIATIGAGTACAGLSIFAFFGCMAATKGMVKLTVIACKWIKGLFRKKEVA